MGLLELASHNSFHSGIYYYQSGAVTAYEKIGDTLYRGVVKGTKEYTIVLNIDHPKKSSCNCPYAEGRAVICKHKVALYLALFPEELKRIENEQKAYEIELEEQAKRREKAFINKKKKIKEYVQSLSIKELKRALLEKMIADLYVDDSMDLIDEEDED